MRVTRLLVLVLGVVVAGAGSTAMADAAVHHGKVNCHGGTIAAGTYKSLRVSGACTLVQSGNVTVRGNVVVTSTGLFNAGTPAKLVVGGDVVVQHHGATAIGCSPDIGCAALGADVVHGSIHGQGAAAVIVHGTSVGGDVTIRGGGQTMDCTVMAPFGAPYYSVVEDSHVHGNLACFNNIAPPQVGDSTGQPNIVGGQRRGECAAL